MSAVETTFDARGWLVPRWQNPGVRALMTTRSAGVSAAPFGSMNLRVGEDAAEAVAQNMALFDEAIGASPVALNQVHGSRVVRVGAADAGRDAARHSADASVTTEPGLACVVMTADCLPVLFAAPGGRGVAAAHAGWRGLAAGVLEATIDALCGAASCAPADLEVWMGACIGPAHFEVGGDVLDAFGVHRQTTPRHTAAKHFEPRGDGKWLADLAGLARDRLQGEGVLTIGGGTWCTVSDRSRFFSYRRDRVTGRMAAAIWIDRSSGGVGHRDSDGARDIDIDIDIA